MFDYVTCELKVFKKRITLSHGFVVSLSSHTKERHEPLKELFHV